MPIFTNPGDELAANPEKPDEDAKPTLGPKAGEREDKVVPTPKS